VPFSIRPFGPVAQELELTMRYRGQNKVCTATFELRLDSDFFMAPSGC
jgi:hypothetical protein